MKKFSLKKITAAVSAAAMIATMGTTAFAASPVSAGQDGDGITITDVTVTQRESGSKLYDVSVTYTTSVAQEIGTTMLTYVKHGTSLVSAQAYTDVEDSEGKKMNIVGVDQKNDTSAFTFAVTTDTNASNGIYMVPGESGLLMLSGDKVTTPAVATVTIPAPAAAKATADAVAIEAYSYDDADALKAKIAAELKDKTANIYAAADGTGVADATYTFTGTETAVLAPVADQTGKYTYTVTIPEGAALSNTKISIPANFTCIVDVTVTTIAWTATTIELAGAKEVSLTKADVTAAGDINTAVKNALVAKGFVIKDANEHSANVTNAPAENVITVSTTDAYNSDATADQTLTYKVTVANAESKQGDVTLATLANGTIEGISVTVAALEANEFIVSSAEATKGGTAVTSATVPNGTSETNAKAALSAAIDNITVKNASGDKTESGWTVDGEWEFDKTYNAASEDAATYTATVSIKAPAERGENKGVNKDGIKLTLTLNVEAKPQGVKFILGDVNGDGKVNGVDVTTLMNHASELIPIADMSDKDGRTFKASDVNGDEKVNGVDVTTLMNHVSELIINDSIGKEFVK